MKIRDRIQDFRRVRASELKPHPRNWRTHPAPQRDALQGILAEIGYADALLVRELEDGTLGLIDGHLRAETTPDTEVPVLVLDLTAEEADKLLVSLDPLAALAGSDAAQLDELLKQVETDNQSLRAMFDGLMADQGNPELPEQDIQLPELYQIIVECQNEAEQKDLYEELTSAGHKCRVLTL